MTGRPRRLLPAAVALLFLAATAGCGSLGTARLLAPTWFGMEAIAPDIYVERGMSPGRRKQVLADIEAARGRVREVFGDLQAEPGIRVCATEECFRSFGGVTAKGKAVGERLVLVSPRGSDPVIFAHELTHIELHRRVGALRALQEVPAWLDEGLAVYVSGDPRYSDEAWMTAAKAAVRVPPLEDLKGSATRWHYASWQLGYGTARRAVGRWMEDVGPDGLARLIERLRAGEPFEAAFLAVSGYPTTALLDG